MKNGENEEERFTWSHQETPCDSPAAAAAAETQGANQMKGVAARTINHRTEQGGVAVGGDSKEEEASPFLLNCCDTSFTQNWQQNPQQNWGKIQQNPQQNWQQNWQQNRRIQQNWQNWQNLGKFTIFFFPIKKRRRRYDDITSIPGRISSTRSSAIAITTNLQATPTSLFYWKKKKKKKWEISTGV